MACTSFLKCGLFEGSWCDDNAYQKFVMYLNGILELFSIPTLIYVVEFDWWLILDCGLKNFVQHID